LSAHVGQGPASLKPLEEVVPPLLLLLLPEVDPPLLLPLLPLLLLEVVPPPSGKPPLLVPIPLDEELLDPPPSMADAPSSPLSVAGGWPLESAPAASMGKPSLLEDEQATQAMQASRDAPAATEYDPLRSAVCGTDTTIPRWAKG
jgi:hypothetical protein